MPAEDGGMESNMNELISVIVPVYKVEAFLNHCIESVINQTYKNFELILVDDGSPDNCSEICDLWEHKDSRVHVIHQKNRGGGFARNQALSVAQGEFITFVDSDDYISPIMFEFLHNQFSDDIDIVECNYCITKDDNAVFDDNSDSYDLGFFSAEEAMRENINDRIFRQLIWNKMYRKSVIKNIRFPVGKKIDDEFWTYQVLGNARKLVYTGKILYAYRQQSNSVMHMLSVDNRMEALEARIQRHQYICREMPAIEEESLYSLWFTCIYQGQLVLRMMDKQNRKNVYDKLQQVMCRYPILKKKLTISKKQQFWLGMASISFYWTCWIRNILKVGL